MIIESASTSLGLEDIATSPMKKAAYLCTQKTDAPNRGDCWAVSALKRSLIADMRSCHEIERLRAPSTQWFGTRVAAVLVNRSGKSYIIGEELSTAKAARETALAIVRWMLSRAHISPEEVRLGIGGDGSPRPKSRKTFAAFLRESTVPNGSAAGSGGVPIVTSSGQLFPLETEWRAYLGRVVALESDTTALGWWRENEMPFRRVALGVRYQLALPATSVTSEW